MSSLRERTFIIFSDIHGTVIIIRRGWLCFLVTSVEPRYVPRTKRDDYLTIVLNKGNLIKALARIQFGGWVRLDPGWYFL